MTRDKEIWEARKRGDTVEELGTRFDLRREKVSQICAKERAREQRVCDEARCRGAVHEPPCPQADPVELEIAQCTPQVQPKEGK